jgi:hypothetical protein
MNPKAPDICTSSTLESAVLVGPTPVMQYWPKAAKEKQVKIPSK